MAKTNGDAAAAELTRADVAKLVKGMVVVPEIGKDGQPVMVRPKEGGAFYKTVEVPVKAEHIIGHAVVGDEVVATTVDGQKLRAKAA